MRLSGVLADQRRCHLYDEADMAGERVSRTRKGENGFSEQESSGDSAANKNITDRKQAEEVLRETEERYRLVAETMRQGIVHQNADGTIIAMNPAAESILGRTRADLLGSSSVREEHLTVREDDSLFPGLEHPAMVALRTGQAVRGVVMGVFNPRLKEKRWISIDAIPLFRPGEPRPAEVYTIFEDITERRKAEAELRQERDFSSAVVNTAGALVIVLEPKGQITRFNRACEALTGYSESEVVGKTWEFLIPPEDLPEVRRVWGDIEAGSFPHQRENYWLTRDGSSRRLIAWSNTALFKSNGEIEYVIGTGLDITERKRAEEERQHSEERLAQAVRVGRLGTFEHDHGSDVIEFSSIMRELMGFGHKQAVTIAGILERVLLDDREALRQAILRAHHPAGNGRFEVEYRVLIGSDRIRWINARSQTFFGGQGSERRPIRTVGAAQDVTERKEAQVRLERLVDERTAKLQDLVGELEHFSYTITHDLKSPLRAMRGFAEIATLTCGESAQEKTKESLARISTSAERMECLITDALNYSRSVRQELPLSDVDMGALLRGMLDSYPELQPSKADIEVGGDLPLVLGNGAGLTQCFSNLLANAVKFVRPGEKAQIRVRPEILADGQKTSGQGWVRIWVEDKGIGISKEMLPRVFDMFSRASKNYEGTGIGLALVRKVTQRMGGRVGVESEEGKGSRFWIELKSAEVSPRAKAAVVTPAERRGGTVLYVEDEESDAMFMQNAFERIGLKSALRVVSDGRSAIEYLSGTGFYGDRKVFPLPSVVLLDLNLPQVPGFEVLRWMRNHPDFVHTPVVVFSSSAREDDRVKALELGATEFVGKPSSGLKFGHVAEKLQERWLVAAVE